MGAPERVADGPVRRVNLAAVETSLRRLQQQLARDGSRDPMDDRVVDNMLAGYGFVDALVADGVQVFAMGNLKHLLELNTVVLCGTSPARRDLYAGHIQATERRFYEERHAGIEDVIEWHAGHAGASSWERAAGV
ncbi:MAG TPA: hypothetical protein VEL75_00855, partial [Candidatus Methylomirabilis sp.]|nr:hypothetical protein [Candidatus Methylomirabilis sp.]